MHFVAQQMSRVPNVRCRTDNQEVHAVVLAITTAVARNDSAVRLCRPVASLSGPVSAHRALVLGVRSVVLGVARTSRTPVRHAGLACTGDRLTAFVC